MSQNIVQEITFKSCTTKQLFEMYMNAKLHSELTNSKAIISSKAGSKFSGYNNYCFGKTLQVIPGKLIVQSWRAADWDKNDIDSTLILLFEQKNKDVIVTMTHANVPDKHVKGLANGWHEFYWKPWKVYLKGVNSK